MRRKGVPGVVYAGAARPMNILGCPPLPAVVTLVCFVAAAFLSHMRPLAALIIGITGLVVFLVGRVIYGVSPFLFAEISTFLTWRGYGFGADSSYIRADDAHFGTRDSFVGKKV